MPKVHSSTDGWIQWILCFPSIFIRKEDKHSNQTSLLLLVQWTSQSFGVMMILNVLFSSIYTMELRIPIGLMASAKKLNDILSAFCNSPAAHFMCMNVRTISDQNHSIILIHKFQKSNTVNRWTWKLSSPLYGILGWDDILWHYSKCWEKMREECRYSLIHYTTNPIKRVRMLVNFMHVLHVYVWKAPDFLWILADRFISKIRHCFDRTELCI